MQAPIRYVEEDLKLGSGCIYPPIFVSDEQATRYSKSIITPDIEAFEKNLHKILDTGAKDLSSLIRPTNQIFSIKLVHPVYDPLSGFSQWISFPLKGFIRALGYRREDVADILWKEANLSPEGWFSFQLNQEGREIKRLTSNPAELMLDIGTSTYRSWNCTRVGVKYLIGKGVNFTLFFNSKILQFLDRQIEFAVDDELRDLTRELMERDQAATTDPVIRTIKDVIDTEATASFLDPWEVCAFVIIGIWRTYRNSGVFATLHPVKSALQLKDLRRAFYIASITHLGELGCSLQEAESCSKEVYSSLRRIAKTYLRDEIGLSGSSSLDVRYHRYDQLSREVLKVSGNWAWERRREATIGWVVINLMSNLGYW